MKSELEAYLPNLESSIVIVTGFVTKEAFKFVEDKITNKQIDKTIIFKLNLNDIQNGSTTFDFKYALSNGWKVYLNNTIHAKNYIFDKKEYIQGSSNLTGNGIGLFEVKDDDNNNLHTYDKSIDTWINKKISESLLVDESNVEYITEKINSIPILPVETIEILQDDLYKNIELVKYNSILENIDKINVEEHSIFYENAFKIFYNQIKENPSKFLDKIDKIKDLNSYIIDLDKPYKNIIEKYNYKLQQYINTPKIYKFKDEYYKEKIRYEEDPNIKCIDVFDEASAKKLIEAINRLYKFDIIVNLDKENIYYREIGNYKEFIFKNISSKAYTKQYIKYCTKENIECTNDEEIKNFIKEKYKNKLINIDKELFSELVENIFKEEVK